MYWGLDISPQELKQGAALVEQALDDLGEPRIYVNRSLDSALQLLRQGGRFSTIHDKVKDPKLDPEARAEIEAYLEGRKGREVALGTLGEGELQGCTVYGSLGFSEKLGAELWQDALLRAAKSQSQPRSTHLNSGIELTAGAVTFVLKPEANQRATYLPSDTYDTRGEKPVAREHLPYAIWANIGSKGDTYFTGEDGSQALLRLPEEQAVHGVERFLTSDAINRGYMEAQVRGAYLEDVERIVLRRHSAGGSREFSNFDEAFAEVTRLAQQWGIPCDEAPAPKPLP
jgi:hypothetical protein